MSNNDNDNDSDSNNNSASKASKLGRKGDPRMHRAVSARLANPEISLFDALRVGGFDYPTNDDASVTDLEKVTLGQRKNQLSRRLRLAKKQLDGGGGGSGKDAGGGHGDNSDGMSHSSSNGRRAANAKGTSPSTSKMMQQQQHQAGGGSKTKADSNNIASRALQMKQEHPDLTSGEYDGDIEGNTNMNQEGPAKRQRIAKFHPDYAPLFVPPPSRNNFTGGANQQNQKIASNPNHQQAPYQNQQGNNYPANSGGAGMPGINMGGPGGFGMGAGGGPFPNPSLFTQQISNAFNAQQAQQPRASGVAISSLTQSAQAVGMSLEQLAMTLASNPGRLAKVMSEASNANSESMQKKHEVALSLYETECRSMYSKCMLMAGIDPRLCQPNTASYLQFALKAWQAEGKRLHDMMGVARNTANLEPPLDAATGEPKGGDNSDDGSSGDQDTIHAHNHGHGHSHTHTHKHNKNNKNSNEDGKSGGGEICEETHIHRLDGQCGHKAIIHQPKDGVAHIDFVIGNNVECYNGCEPIGKNFHSIWPSKYKCSDYAENCHTNCARSNKAAHDKLEQMSTSSGGGTPKIIPLAEINLQDPEWNYDVNGFDGGVMGLFKLGERHEDIDNISTL
jgi:hypothetical protein